MIPLFIVRDPYDRDQFRVYARANGDRGLVKPIFYIGCFGIWTLGDLFPMSIVERLDAAPATAFPVAVTLELKITDEREVWQAPE